MKINPYLISPLHPVTIKLVGVGGTGSFVLPRLARLDYALQNINHPGIYVYAYDDDVVTKNNIGRQNFFEHEIGLNKASVMIEKCNLAYNLDWSSVMSLDLARLQTNIIISCVDNIDYRKKLSKNIKNFKTKKTEPYEAPFLWIDTGNGKDFGQVVVKDILDPNSKDPFDFFDFNYSDTTETQGILGCSYFDSLQRQDLFINDIIACNVADILWNILGRGIFEHSGTILNRKNLIQKSL